MGIDWAGAGQFAKDAWDFGGQFGHPIATGLGWGATAAGLGWLATGGPEQLTNQWGTDAGNWGDLAQGASDFLPGENPWLDQYAQGQQKTEDYWKDWYPGKVINEGGPNNPRDKPLIDPNTAKGIPENIGNAIDTGIANTADMLDKYKMQPGSSFEDMNDPNSPMYNNPARLTSNYVQNFDPSQYGSVIDKDIAERDMYGPAGERYSQTEADALAAMQQQGQGGGYAKEMGQNVTDFQGLLTKPKTDVENAYQQNLLLAQQGKLSAQDTEWSKNQSALIDRQAEDEVKKIRESAGAAGGFRSGAADRRIQDVYDRARQDKNALLSTAQREMSQGAQAYINSSNTAQNDINQIAASLAQNTGAAKSTANQQVLSHITNMANQATAQTGQKLDQARLGLDAEMDKMKGLMEDSQWQNEYDLKLKDTYFKNFTSFIGTIIQGMQGLLNIGKDLTAPVPTPDIQPPGGGGQGNQKSGITGVKSDKEMKDMLDKNPGLLGQGPGAGGGGTYKPGTSTGGSDRTAGGTYGTGQDFGTKGTGGGLTKAPGAGGLIGGVTAKKPAATTTVAPRSASGTKAGVGGLIGGKTGTTGKVVLGKKASTTKKKASTKK